MRTRSATIGVEGSVLSVVVNRRQDGQDGQANCARRDARRTQQSDRPRCLGNEAMVDSLTLAGLQVSSRQAPVAPVVLGRLGQNVLR